MPNLSCEERKLAAEKLGVKPEDVEKVLEELASGRVFVHYTGEEPPKIEGVEYLRVFPEMKVASARVTVESLVKLLMLDEVEKVEPVPRVKAIEED